MLNRLQFWLESYISMRVACLVLYALGVITIWLEVAAWESWTWQAVSLWVLLFAMLTSALARGLLILARAKHMDGTAATEHARAALTTVFFPFIALIVVAPWL